MAAVSAQTAEQPRRQQRPADKWREYTDFALRSTRKNAIKAGEWPLPRFAPIPKAAWLVDDHAGDPDGDFSFLTLQERELLGILHQIHEHQREQVKSEPGLKNLKASLTDLEELSRCCRRTVQRRLKRLIAKEVLGLNRLRGKVESGPDRCEITEYFLRDFATARRRLKANPEVYTDANGYFWHNGRSTSKRLLSPAEAETWRIQHLPPPPSQKHRPPAADVVPPQPAKPPVPKPPQPQPVPLPELDFSDTIAIVTRLQPCGFMVDDPESHAYIRTWRQWAKDKGEELSDDVVHQQVYDVFLRGKRQPRLGGYYNSALKNNMPAIVNRLRREREKKAVENQRVHDGILALARDALARGEAETLAYIEKEHPDVFRELSPPR